MINNRINNSLNYNNSLSLYKKYLVLTEQPKSDFPDGRMTDIRLWYRSSHNLLTGSGYQDDRQDAQYRLYKPNLFIPQIHHRNGERPINYSVKPPSMHLSFFLPLLPSESRHPSLINDLGISYLSYVVYPHECWHPPWYRSCFWECIFRSRARFWHILCLDLHTSKVHFTL